MVSPEAEARGPGEAAVEAERLRHQLKARLIALWRVYQHDGYSQHAWACVCLRVLACREPGRGKGERRKGRGRRVEGVEGPFGRRDGRRDGVPPTCAGEQRNYRTVLVVTPLACDLERTFRGASRRIKPHRRARGFDCPKVMYWRVCSLPSGAAEPTELLAITGINRANRANQPWAPANEAFVFHFWLQVQRIERRQEGSCPTRHRLQHCTISFPLQLPA